MQHPVYKEVFVSYSFAFADLKILKAKYVQMNADECSEHAQNWQRMLHPSALDLLVWIRFVRHGTRSQLELHGSQAGNINRNKANQH